MFRYSICENPPAIHYRHADRTVARAVDGNVSELNVAEVAHRLGANLERSGAVAADARILQGDVGNLKHYTEAVVALEHNRVVAATGNVEPGSVDVARADQIDPVPCWGNVQVPQLQVADVCSGERKVPCPHQPEAVDRDVRARFKRNQFVAAAERWVRGEERREKRPLRRPLTRRRRG